MCRNGMDHEAECMPSVSCGCVTNMQAVALTYMTQHEGSSHYKALLKGLLKAALENVSVQARSHPEDSCAQQHYRFSSACVHVSFTQHIDADCQTCCKTPACICVQETKDIETTIAGLRADKVKAEAAAAAAAKKGAPVVQD